MGKLGVLVGAERLYRYSVALGFGTLTGLSFPGEACGLLRSPARWSKRSCPTIAIGHELSVTPLQLALAYAAIANGGVVMEPMLVREVVDDEGRAVRRFSPRATRRVFSESTTLELRDMLSAVVDSGTAKSARIPGLKVAGKTGTAQKYKAEVRTYGKGMYLSSFAGFAPADDPCMVGVVVIDEPRGKHYYGGDVAAPVFREVVLDLLRLPHGPFESNGMQVASRPPAPAPVSVPDLRLLLPGATERRLAESGLRARFRGAGTLVLAQEPGAGQAIERGASVTVWLSPPADSSERRLPELAGLPLREALRRLTRLGVTARIEGRGVVVRQTPAAGTELPLPGTCRLWCEPVLAAVAVAGSQETVRNRDTQ
jgi:stage V sporulation protein D (sporulation-specific penicillin-binding protein)